MQRHLAKLAAASLTPILLTGASATGYQPNADPMQLAVYAGKANYPYEVHSEFAPHLFATVAPDATITLYNAGDEPLTDFELWVNKLYTLHVDKLDSRSSKAIDPKFIYNSKAENLVNAPANTLTTIQIYLPVAGKLLDVQGPIIPH